MADILFTQIAGENLRSGTDLIQTSGRDAIGIAPGRYVSDSTATPTLFAAHPRFVAKSSNNRYWRALPPKGRIGILFSAWHTDPIVNRVMGEPASQLHERHDAADFNTKTQDKIAM